MKMMARQMSKGSYPGRVHLTEVTTSCPIKGMDGLVTIQPTNMLSVRQCMPVNSLFLAMMRPWMHVNFFAASSLDSGTRERYLGLDATHQHYLEAGKCQQTPGCSDQRCPGCNAGSVRMRPQAEATAGLHACLQSRRGDCRKQQNCWAGAAKPLHLRQYPLCCIVGPACNRSFSSLAAAA